VSSEPAIVLLHSTSTRIESWRTATENVRGLSFAAVVEDRETKSLRTELILENWASYEAFEESDMVKSAESAIRIRPIAGFLGREDRSKL
jgi:hypothetical protein